jgi:hypothetical protein
MKGGGGRTSVALFTWYNVAALVPVAPGGNLAHDGGNFLNGAPLASRPITHYVCTGPGIVRRLFIYINPVIGAGADVNFVLYKNEVATSIVVNIGGAAEVTDSDLTNVVEVVAGDRLHVHADRGAGVPAAVEMLAVLEYVRRN